MTFSFPIILILSSIDEPNANRNSGKEGGGWKEEKRTMIIAWGDCGTMNVSRYLMI
jgi:hypothetical protein